MLWTRQFGTDAGDGNWGVSADGLGNVYVSGYTDGDLGALNAGTHDPFVSKFDSAGNLLWTTQFGTGVDDLSFGVSADGLGNVFISGETEGILGAANAGLTDAFVAKVRRVPEPSSTLLAMIGCLAGLLHVKRNCAP